MDVRLTSINLFECQWQNHIARQVYTFNCVYRRQFQFLITLHYITVCFIFLQHFVSELFVNVSHTLKQNSHSFHNIHIEHSKHSIHNIHEWNQIQIKITQQTAKQTKNYLKL